MAIDVNRMNFWVLLLAAVVAAAMQSSAAAQIVLSNDFDSASLDVDASTITNADSDTPIITLNPFDSIMATGLTYQFDVSGVAGKRPIFRVPLYANASNAHDQGHRYLYSHDGGGTYTFFDNGTFGSDYYTFQPSSGFAHDTVRIAHSLPYPVAKTQAHTLSLQGNPYVTTTLSGGSDFVIGQTHGTAQGGYVDALGENVPQQDLYGYRITGPNSGQPKTRVVLTSGNHASEHTALYVLQGMVDFLLSDDPQAADLRRSAEFYIYPQSNPEGRHAGYYRSNPQHRDLDHNRDWIDDPQYAEIETLQAAMTQDTGGEVDYFLDFHNTANDDLQLWGRGENEDSAFFAAIHALRPNIEYYVFDVGTSAQDWAASHGGLSAAFSFTPETGFVPGAQADWYFALGKDYALALHDVIPIHAVPEPTSLAVVGAAGALMMLRSRRRSTC